MQISHRDATALHEHVLNLVESYRNEDGSWNAEAVESIAQRLEAIRAHLLPDQVSR